MSFIVHTSDGGLAIKDEETYHKFDMFGKYVCSIPVTPAMLETKESVRIVSVLTSCGITEVYEEGKTSFGSADTVIELTDKKGYAYRLRRTGDTNGIRYTQTLFIYRE